MDRTAEARLGRDAAYGCFLFAGLVEVAVAVVSSIPMGTGTAGGLGLLVFVPLVIAALLTMVAGTVLTVSVRNEAVLWLLAGLTVARLAQFFAEWGPVAFRNAAPLIYGAVAVLSSVWWFGVRRRKSFSTPSVDGN